MVVDVLVSLGSANRRVSKSNTQSVRNSNNFHEEHKRALTMCQMHKVFFELSLPSR